METGKQQVLRRLERIVNSLEVLIFNSLTIGFVKEESETGQKKVSIFPSRHLYKYFSFSPDRRFSEASYSIQIYVKSFEMTNSCFWKYWPTWASSFEGRECSMRHIFQLELLLFKYLSMIWWFYFISMREIELSSQCPHVLPSIVGRPPNDMRMLEFVWNNWGFF